MELQHVGKSHFPQLGDRVGHPIPCFSLRPETVEGVRKLRGWLQMNYRAKRLECVELAPALRQRQQAGRTLLPAH